MRGLRWMFFGICAVWICAWSYLAVGIFLGFVAPAGPPGTEVDIIPMFFGEFFAMLMIVPAVVIAYLVKPPTIRSTSPDGAPTNDVVARLESMSEGINSGAPNE